MKKQPSSPTENCYGIRATFLPRHSRASPVGLKKNAQQQPRRSGRENCNLRPANECDIPVRVRKGILRIALLLCTTMAVVQEQCTLACAQPGRRTRRGFWSRRARRSCDNANPAATSCKASYRLPWRLHLDDNTRLKATAAQATRCLSLGIPSRRVLDEHGMVAIVGSGILLKNLGTGRMIGNVDSQSWGTFQE